MAGSLNNPSDEELRDIFARLAVVTSCGVMTPVLRRAYKAAAASDVNVLLEGETGTGKQVLARAIHQLDRKRRAFPLIIAHCSTISEALAESEFFGHSRGSFTGAVASRPGLFQSANKGTLLLDDVNDLPLSIQPKLLDVIQRGVLRPLGADRERPVDVRIIATSNQPLKSLVAQNRFRSDLYYRLNVIRLQLPPLRARPSDLEHLMIAFARQNRNIYEPILNIEPELVTFLRSQFLGGNIRELEHAVLRMLFTKNQGTSLSTVDWVEQASDDKMDDPWDPLGEAAQRLWESISQRGLSYTQAIRQLEKKVFETALNVDGQTRRQIAASLGTSERTLYYKIRIHRLAVHRSILSP
jgi:transcriptional regulator with PAS, ATPase and Fis domain